MDVIKGHFEVVEKENLIDEMADLYSILHKKQISANYLHCSFKRIWEK